MKGHTRNAGGARPWTDFEILDALHLLDHAGLTAAEVGRRMGVSKGAILGLSYRTRHDSLRHFPSVADDGTLPPRWWSRS